MDDEFIDYGQLIDDAMHIIVKRALERVVAEGLPGRHHFFISFVTNFPGVELSDTLRQKYPDEMTVVLQHQFEGLEVLDDCFKVTLSFDGQQEPVVVPFNSLVAFADPSVKFGLQFRHSEEAQLLSEVTELIEDDELGEGKENTVKGAKGGKRKKKADGDQETVNNVISIDSFRKK